MNGIQFKALMAAADLSVRGAADYLDVSTTTIERWREAKVERSRIPAWAVARLRVRVAELAGPAAQPE